jgi:putative membrane-bound dehydrogenase-like protein
VPILDGFTVSPNSHHTFANGLAWGPDGWLYGRCGASSPGEIGAPGSAPAERVPLRGGIWRYHPERKVFEAICHGTTNPWGLDWDDLGNGFFTNTVNGHLWRVLPGAHYARSHTVEPHPWIVEPLGPHADHDHFDSGRHWTESRDGRADAHGGGHAHTGCVIVPDEPGWPTALRGRLLTLNLHGRRINVDRLDAEPNGIVGRHEPDLARFGDPFFRGTDLLELPGRRLAVLDWSDTGECHEGTGVHRTSGRIYRFSFVADDALPAAVSAGTDVEALPAADLVRLLTADRWHARLATHLLADRQAAGDTNGELEPIVPGLEDLVARGDTVTLRLRALWALWALQQIDEPSLLSLLEDPEPALRCWALRLLSDAWPIDTVLGDRPTADRAIPPSTPSSVSPAPRPIPRYGWRWPALFHDSRRSGERVSRQSLSRRRSSGALPCHLSAPPTRLHGRWGAITTISARCSGSACSPHSSPTPTASSPSGGRRGSPARRNPTGQGCGARSRAV